MRKNIGSIANESRSSTASASILPSLFALFALLVLPSCGIEANIQALGQIASPDINEPTNRKEPDFLSGQVVTTSQGYQLRAVFGELPENQVSNGHEIMAVIHE